MTTSFEIKNTTEHELLIVHEPECFQFEIPPNDSVTIVVNSVRGSVLIRHYLQDGKICISITEDKSEYRVLHNGVDVFAKYFDA